MYFLDPGGCKVFGDSKQVTSSVVSSGARVDLALISSIIFRMFLENFGLNCDMLGIICEIFVFDNFRVKL